MPVLYLGPGMNATNHTLEVLEASSMLRDSAGKPLPMAPLMSWIFFGPGKDSRCAVPFAELHKVLDVVATYDAAQLPVVSWWSGSDAGTPNVCNGWNVSQLEWLTEGKLVPERCL